MIANRSFAWSAFGFVGQRYRIVSADAQLVLIFS